ARYEVHAKAVSDEEAARMLREVRREEQAHGRVIREMVAPVGPQGVLDLMLRTERWHKRGGGWIGDAIYGANDGLGAVFGIVSGVAGGSVGSPPNGLLGRGAGRRGRPPSPGLLARSAAE